MDPLALLRLRTKELERAEKALRESSNHHDEVKKAHEIIERTNQTLEVVQEHAQDIITELEKLRNVAADFMKAIPDLLDLNIKEMSKEPSAMSKFVGGVRRKLLNIKEESSSLSSSYQSNRLPVGSKLHNDSQVLLALAKTQNELLEIIIKTTELFSKIEVGNIVADATIKDLGLQLFEWYNALEQFRNIKSKIENEEREKKKRQEEVENKRKERERKKKEENDRKRIEEEAKRENEKKEKLQKEETEQKQKEEQQRKEEERFKKEEEAKRQREEEEERKKKEDERLREEKEELERLLKEEEDRKKKEEEQKERLRKEEEERVKREEEEKKRSEEEAARRNPKNWIPLIYFRTYKKEFERKNIHERTFHGGVSAVIFAMPNSITKNSLECISTDDNDEIRMCHKKSNERIIGSLTSIRSVSQQKISVEVPMQIYVPYADIPVTHIPQIVLCLDSNKQALIRHLPVREIEDTPGISYIGCEINNLIRLQMYVIAVRRPEEFWYNGTRIEHELRENTLRIVVHQGEFRPAVLISVQDHHIEKDEFKKTKTLHKELKNIKAAKGCFRITTSTSSELHIDIEANEKEDGKNTVISSAHRSIDGSWKVLSAHKKEKTIIFTLPDNIVQEDIVVMIIPAGMSNNEICHAAKAVYQHCHEDIVTLILRQKKRNEADAELECVKRNEVKRRLKELKDIGYSEGPSESSDFCIKDGEKILIGFFGNITADRRETDDGELIPMVYRSHMCTARLSMHLTVDDKYQHQIVKSRYQGYLSWNVPDGGNLPSRSGQLTVYLRKTTKVMADEKLPKENDWRATALSKFIGKYVDINQPVTFKWKTVLAKLLPSKIHNIETSYSDKTDAEKCTELIFEWMSKGETAERVDKLLQCFKESGENEMAEVIRKFVKEYNTIFNDRALAEMMKTIGGEWRFFGIELGISACTLERIEGSHRRMDEVIFSMLKAARISDDVIRNGENLKEFLLHAARKAGGGNELMNFIRSKL